MGQLVLSNVMLEILGGLLICILCTALIPEIPIFGNHTKHANLEGLHSQG